MSQYVPHITQYSLHQLNSGSRTWSTHCEYNTSYVHEYIHTGCSLYRSTYTQCKCTTPYANAYTYIHTGRGILYNVIQCGCTTSYVHAYIYIYIYIYIYSEREREQSLVVSSAKRPMLCCIYQVIC